jgi:hypothetical protein
VALFAGYLHLLHHNSALDMLYMCTDHFTYHIHILLLFYTLNSQLSYSVNFGRSLLSNARSRPLRMTTSCARLANSHTTTTTSIIATGVHVSVILDATTLNLKLCCRAILQCFIFFYSQSLFHAVIVQVVIKADAPKRDFVTRLLQVHEQVQVQAQLLLKRSIKFTACLQRVLFSSAALY